MSYHVEGKGRLHGGAEGLGNLSGMDGVTDDDGTDGIPDFLFQRIEGAAAEGEHDGIKALDRKSVV